MRRAEKIVRVFTKPNCCLCDQAIWHVKRLEHVVSTPFELETIDIEKYKEYEKYRFEVPVIEVNGEIVSSESIDGPAIKEALE